MNCTHIVESIIYRSTKSYTLKAEIKLSSDVVGKYCNNESTMSETELMSMRWLVIFSVDFLTQHDRPE